MSYPVTQNNIISILVVTVFRPCATGPARLPRARYGGTVRDLELTETDQARVLFVALSGLFWCGKATPVELMSQTLRQKV